MAQNDILNPEDFEALKFYNKDSKINKKMRWFFYYILVLTIIYFCGNEQEFIYFQF